MGKCIDSTYNHNTKWSVAYDTILITNKTTINGIEGYYMGSPIPTEAIVCLNSDEQGNCVIIGGTSNINKIITQSIAYKNYPQLGEKWILNDLNYNEKTGFVVDTLSFICVGIDIPITTADGTFICNAYSHKRYSGYNNQQVDRFIDYFARGIGRIKAIHYENETKLNISTLTKYKVN